MQTSALNAIPIYQNSDPLDYGAQQLATLRQIDSRLPSRFSTQAQADTAFSAYTAQGGVVTDGMIRTIAGYIQTYRGGQWRGIQPTVRQQTNFFETSFGGSGEVGVATLQIPDIGHPVLVDCSGLVTVFANSGAQVQTFLRLDAIGGPLCSPVGIRDVSHPNGAGLTITFPPYRIGPITGTHNLICTVTRVAGSGNWAVTAGGNFLRAELSGP